MFANFTFEFRRFNIDGLFISNDRIQMLNWINQARSLLIDILRNEGADVLHIWLNVYNGIYDKLNTSMTTSKCMNLLRTPPTYDDPCSFLANVISSFDISIPHPTSLRSPISGLAQRVFDFSHDCAAAKIVDGIPTILLNHQMFDILREKQDEDDIISESIKILFIAIVLAHEITHCINLARSMGSNTTEKETPKLLLFRSYSRSGEIDAGNLIERLLLDGELHLSKPPPTPPRLFLIVSADSTQVTVPNEVVDECIQARSVRPINQLLNLWQQNANQSSTNNRSLKGSVDQVQLEPLLTFPTAMIELSQPGSPTMPVLQSMMHAL